MDSPLKKIDLIEVKKSLKKIPWDPEGKVSDVVGMVVEAKMPHSKLSTVAEIEVESKGTNVLAEVVGFKGDRTLLLPYSSLTGIGPGSRIKGQRFYDQFPVGDYLLGQIVDPFLRSLSGTPLYVPKGTSLIPLENEPPNPLSRSRINKVMPLGIRAIDGLLTFCEGQRMGIMAGSGVGKSVLLGMVARGSGAEINVIGLIGERGREVRELIEKEIGPEGLSRSVIVVSTSDQSPLMRIRAAKMVTSIAEYFSAQGKKVLLMMDSLTRVAQAQREIGLAIGEPPTTKGYTPSVFSLLPKLLERCGPQPTGKGSISGLYTVLVDGDDFNDPIPDTVRSILDGHVVLTRQLANSGHFPAIDIMQSISRVMNDVVTDDHREKANFLKSLISTYYENLDYIQIGSYHAGSNRTLDLAIKLMPRIKEYLCQDMKDLTSFFDAIGGIDLTLGLSEGNKQK